MSVVQSTDLSAAQADAHRDLVDATRELMLAVGLTGAEAGPLTEAAAQLRSIAAELSQDDRERLVRVPVVPAAELLEAGTTQPIGEFNPTALPFELVFDADGQGLTATVLPNSLHEGPANGLNGGIAGWLMDMAIGGLVLAQGRRSPTVHLEMDYLGLTPLDVELTVGARITSREGRKTWAEGWIEYDGRRTVQAKALFIDVRE